MTGVPLWSTPSDGHGRGGPGSGVRPRGVRGELGRLRGSDDRQPTGPDGSWLEPLTVPTAIAATTTRTRLGTAVLLAALRRPAVLAKQLPRWTCCRRVGWISVSESVGSVRSTKPS